MCRERYREEVASTGSTGSFYLLGEQGWALSQAPGWVGMPRALRTEARPLSQGSAQPHEVTTHPCWGCEGIRGKHLISLEHLNKMHRELGMELGFGRMYRSW